jgi:hypothetical protein
VNYGPGVYAYIDGIGNSSYDVYLFHGLEFAEHQRSGLKPIREKISLLGGYTDQHEPQFFSTV